MGLFGLLVAKFLDPIGGIIALAIGTIAAPRWMIAIGAVSGALVTEIILQTSQYTRQFNPAIFLIGVFALGIWALVGNVFVRKMFSKGAAK